MADDGRGTFLTGSAEGTGAVQGVQGVDGVCIGGRVHEDTTWASGRVDIELDNHGHGGRTADVPHGLPVQGRPADLTG